MKERSKAQNAQIEVLTSLRGEIEERMKLLAGDALKLNQTSFLELAKATFEENQKLVKSESEKKEEAIRLDKWLKKNFSSLKQSFIEKNIRKKNILVNKLKKTSSYKLIYQDEITILNFDQEKYRHFPPIKKLHIIPKKLQELFNSSIVYENNNFIILNKWTGIATQGGSKINISIDHIIKNISPYQNTVQFDFAKFCKVK